MQSAQERASFFELQDFEVGHIIDGSESGDFKTDQASRITLICEKRELTTYNPRPSAGPDPFNHNCCWCARVLCFVPYERCHCHFHCSHRRFCRR